MEFIAFIFFTLFIGALVALFRGHLNLFKIIPIPNRKSASILTVIFFVLFVLTTPEVEDDANTLANNQGNNTENEQVQKNNEREDEESEDTSENTEKETTTSSDESNDSSEVDESTEDKTTNNQDQQANRDNQNDDEQSENNQNQDDENQSDSSTDDSTNHNQNESENSASEESSTTDSTDDTSSSNSDDQSEQNNNPNLETATVTRVVDGDTIEIKLNGKSEDVRLLLVDTPETKHPSKPVQPFGPEASEFARNKLSGEQVQIEFDGPKRDQYDRILAYLWIDGQNFNQMLLEEGLARLAYIYDPPYTHRNAFEQAEASAKNAHRGIWSISNYVQSEGFIHEEQNAEDNESTDSNASGYTGPYDPHGGDKDCGDFDTHDSAQAFFEAAGGPNSDPHRLDRDGNGAACESLP